MIPGTIDVSDPENVTGTGLAFEMFQGAMSAVPPENLSVVAASMKPYFEGLAAAIVNHIKNNASITVTVHTTDSGLQRVGGVDTQGPGTNKQITGGTIA